MFRWLWRIRIGTALLLALALLGSANRSSADVSPGTDQAVTPRITRSPFTIPDSCSRSKIR